MGARAQTIQQRLLFDVSVLGAGVIRAQIFGLQLLGVNLLKALSQFVAGALRSLQISFQTLTNDADLLLELMGVNLSGRADRFDLGVIFSKSGI